MNRLPDDPDRTRISRWAAEYGPAVRGYLAMMVRDANVADDLWQEVFQRAWKARHRYQENGAVKAYLFRIADHLVCDYSRRRRMEVQLDEAAWQQCEPAASDQSPDEALQRAELRKQLFSALDRLTPAQRRVLLLRYFSQLGFQQIADITDCPLNTVLSHCRRGLTALRGLLTGCSP